MLTTNAIKLAVHTLITSRLDYCNSLLIGVNESLLKRLQNIQRTSARLVTRKRKYDPVTADLIELRWLPIGALTSKFLFLFSNPFTRHLNTKVTCCFKNSPMSDGYASIHCFHTVLLNFAPSAQPLLTDPFPAIMVRKFGISYRHIKCAGSIDIFNMFKRLLK